MRIWPFISVFALLGALQAGEEPGQPTYPLWDGQETVEQYALRINLPPTQTLDLGNGVKLEVVLIPAGKFIMGIPEPVPVDEAGFYKRIQTGQALLALGGGTMLVLMGTMTVHAIRNRQRPRFSLAWLLALTVTSGIALLSGLHWRHSVQVLERVRAEYQAAQAKYNSAYPPEKPAHRVTLPLPFYLGKCEVTQGQYQQVINKNPSRFVGKDLPVEMVSWEDAQEFCKQLTALAKRKVRLPTSAEWEFSCRAGSKTTYCSGDTKADLDRVAWFDANTTHSVGKKEANAFGLFDMHGNVYEWCEDWFSETYYATSPEVDPQGPPNGNLRVMRGGSWRGGNIWASGFDHFGEGFRHDEFGFRVVVAPAFRTP